VVLRTAHAVRLKSIEYHTPSAAGKARHRAIMPAPAPIRHRRRSGRR
jgi:hypothetical protein